MTKKCSGVEEKERELPKALARDTSQHKFARKCNELAHTDLQWVTKQTPQYTQVTCKLQTAISVWLQLDSHATKHGGVYLKLDVIDPWRLPKRVIFHHF